MIIKNDTYSFDEHLILKELLGSEVIVDCSLKVMKSFIKIFLTYSYLSYFKQSVAC